LYRGTKDFKKVYQPRTNIEEDEKGDFVTDLHAILARWRNHFSQLLNVRGVNDVSQTEIHTVEPLVPELSAFDVEMAIKSPDINQILAELIKVGVEHFAVRSIKFFILFGIRMNCLRYGRSRSYYLFI
jgi:hypothetical protein